MCWGPIESWQQGYVPSLLHPASKHTNTHIHTLHQRNGKKMIQMVRDDLRNNTRWFLICDSCKRSASLLISVEAEWYLSDIAIPLKRRDILLSGSSSRFCLAEIKSDLMLREYFQATLEGEMDPFWLKIFPEHHVLQLSDAFSNREKKAFWGNTSGNTASICSTSLEST